MIRFGSVVIGLVFVLTLLWAAFTPREAATPDVVKQFHLHPRELHLASDGPFGRFDRQQLQRGFQVYKEVCSACHSLKHVAIRSLTDLGFTEAEVKALAKQFTVPSVDPNTGEPSTRPAISADHFPSPYPNEIAARAANNNALPPDLSLITKARHEGPAYVYSLLTGYHDVPANLPAENRPATGLHYNPYFANLNLAMPAPLGPDQVTYADGTKATVDQEAKDVSAFLVWTAEPKLENRHRTGLGVLIFLLITTVLAYMSYRTVWAREKH